eukprot:1954607-Pyramimonas_sp.AAC.1
MPGRGRCTHPFGHESLAGLSASGEYRTAAAKQYPPQMCKAIGLSVVAGLPPSNLSVAELHSAMEARAPQLAPYFAPLDPCLS